MHCIDVILGGMTGKRTPTWSVPYPHFWKRHSYRYTMYYVRRSKHVVKSACSSFSIIYLRGRLAVLMIFDPRDARSAYYSAVFAVVRVRVCPSVRPSHASIISKRIHILKLFDHLVAPYHSSLLTPCVGIQFQGEPFERGRNTRT